MKRAEIESIIKKHLHRVAPEADLESLKPNDEFGQALNIDSMDFYNVMVGISEELHVDIPEDDYGQLTNMDALTDFLSRQASKTSKK